MATMEKLEGSKVKLTIEVAADEFEKAVEKAYLKTKKNFNVPVSYTHLPPAPGLPDPCKAGVWAVLPTEGNEMHLPVPA